jgi:predicted permease
VVEREMQAEIALHLERATERFVTSGMSPADARAAARREFGYVEGIKEEARDARGGRWFDDLRKDVRYGLRSLLRTPVFTIVALLSLTLGIGLNTALFTLLQAALHPSVVEEPETLVTLGDWRSYAEFAAVRERSRSLTRTFARSTEWVLLASEGVVGDEPMRAAQLVSDDFFAALRVTPLLGRTFARDENGAPNAAAVAVLSYRFWQSRFGGDSSVLGKLVRLQNGVSFSVIGIMPRTFTGADRHRPDFWLPLGMRDRLPAFYRMPPRDAAGWFGASRETWLRVSGRLAPGSSVVSARAELGTLLHELTRADSTAAAALELETADASGLNGTSEKLSVALVACATLAVLLIACANIANLMLARAAARQREIAVRICLGATRRRLVRQLLVESIVLASIGAVAALIVDTWTLRALALSGALEPIASGDADMVARSLMPNGWVLAYTMLLALLSAVSFGLVPALRATRSDPSRAIKGDGNSFGDRLIRSRLRHGLVVGQVALSLMLLVSAAVLVRSVLRVVSHQPGFNRERVFAVSTPGALRAYDSLRVARFETALSERLTRTAGVRELARGTLPVVQRARAWLSSGGEASDSVSAFMAGVTPAFFAALDIPIVRGRSFSDDELRQRAPVVVLSVRTARTLWPGEDPIGKQLSVSPNRKSESLGRFPQSTVIGVAGDAELVNLGAVPAAFVYVPNTTETLLVRVSGSADPAPTIRKLAADVDGSVPVSVQSLESMIMSDEEFVGAKLAATFAMSIGLLALMLATAGVFGVVAYAVSQRTRELGIRTALGATPAAVIGLVVRNGLRLVALGAGVGILAGLAATRLMAALLFGMSPLDPAALLGIALTLLSVALLGCYLPARRAASVEPIALRHD